MHCFASLTNVSGLAVVFGKIVRGLRGNMPQVVLASFAGIHLDRLTLLEVGRG